MNPNMVNGSHELMILKLLTSQLLSLSPFPNFDYDMEHDLSPYRDNLVNVPYYASNDALDSSVSWLAQRTGDILINTDTNQNAVLSVVGRVLDNRLDCTPLGNIGNRAMDKLPSAKYQLLLGQPSKTVFADDFKPAIENLQKIEKKIGSTKNFQHMIVNERNDHVLRFTRAVFEPRQPAIPGKFPTKHKTYAYHARSKGVVDTLTEEWPVPFKFRATMDDIKHTHRAIPLRVFRDEKLVNVNDIMDVLAGALIEMHFEIRHYAIKGSDPPLDSFNASIQQIMVLQPGEARPPTAYKRSTDDDGPIRMNPTLAALQHESVSAQEVPASSPASSPASVQ
ncbi:hypothetical protein V8E53_004483 [Lactarius tabidus]